MDKKEILERRKLAWEGWFYSIQRIDLLIVAICSGEIFACLETMKFLVENQQPIDSIIKWSGGVFLIGLISNLIAQYAGYKANYYDYLMSDAQLDDKKKEAKKYDCKSENYSKTTIWLNNISLFGLIIGLILLLIYYCFIFYV